MGKKKDVESLVALEDREGGRPRLHKLVVANFRSIGNNPIEIDLDDIVVLVGPNNAGKSSILRAYETVMLQGSKGANLTIDDFPNRIVALDRLPMVELQTVINNELPGARWIQDLGSGEKLIRERWIWSSPNVAPVRQGFDVVANEWSEQVPWGAPNVANTRRPIPHRIDAFASPDEQATKIAGLITNILNDSLESTKAIEEGATSEFENVLDSIRQLQARVVSEANEQISIVEAELSIVLSRIFPDHKVKIDAKADSEVEKSFTPFKATPDILIGPTNGFMSSISHQGSGARRTLLWAALKYLSERKDDSSSRPHVLLLDEPEICLHPNAIREAREVLYDLPDTQKWQVMITTHSPVFIDLSKDNTTVIRVSRDENSEVASTTLYRPDKAKLSKDDKKNMKLLNVCDPYLHEFFFGGRQIIVEGDTEYTAFSLIKEKHPGLYSDVHIIRARGKGIIPSVARVLLQFDRSVVILHDSDSPLTNSGAKNPAWGMNESIIKVKDMVPGTASVRVVACLTDFESAMLDNASTRDKPYQAVMKIRSEPETERKVRALLDGLLSKDLALPNGILEWTSINELKSAVGLHTHYQEGSDD